MHLKGPINNNYSVSLPFPPFRMDCQLWSLVIIVILLLKTHNTVSNWKQNALLKQRRPSPLQERHSFDLMSDVLIS